MRLVEIHVDGFGKLVNKTLIFSPGFNLIFGVNEAGKSTLQQAILCLLYSFFRENRRVREEERALWQALKPWERGAPYQGELVYHLDSGQEFRVQRTFAPQFNATLTTYPDMADVSLRFKRGEEGRLFVLEEQLGLSREVFENVCTVRQAELTTLETSATAVTETLLRLSASAAADTRVTDALARLEQVLELDVGVIGTPTRPLGKAQQQLDNLEKEWRQVEQARRELSRHTTALNQFQEQLQQLELKRQQYYYLQLVAESRSTSQQIATVEQAIADISHRAREVNRWAAWEDFPVHLREGIVRLTTQRSQLQAAWTAAQPQLEQTRENLERLRESLEQLSQAALNLADARDFPASALPAVQTLVHSWQVREEAKKAAAKRLQRATTSLEKVKARLQKEQAVCQPAIKLGQAGLAELKQRLAVIRWQVERASQEFKTAQEAWIGLNLTDTQLAAWLAVDRMLQDRQPVAQWRVECSQVWHLQEIEALKQAEAQGQELDQQRRTLQYLHALAEAEALRDQLRITVQAAAELERCEAEANTWQEWANFPIHLHQRLIERQAVYQRLQVECDEARQAAGPAEEKLLSLQESIAATEQRIAALTETLSSSGLDFDEPKTLELAYPWRAATEVQQLAEERLRQTQDALQGTEQDLAERQFQLEPLLNLGVSGLAGLHYLLKQARQRVEQGALGLHHAQAEWNQTGMEEDRFVDMERAAAWIQASAQEDQKQSKRLRQFLARQSAPTYGRKQVLLYGWLKTLYNNMIRSRREASEAEQDLVTLETEIWDRLGHLLDNTLSDEAFTRLGQRLDGYTRSMAEVELQRASVVKQESELHVIRQKSYRARHNLQEQLAMAGLDVTDLKFALDHYLELSEQSKQLKQEKDRLEQLTLQGQALTLPVETWREKQRAREAVQEELFDLLNRAGIDGRPADMEGGLARFYQGVESFKNWTKANSVYQAARQHSHLSDNQARGRLENSLDEVETRLAGLKADLPPQVAELIPSKTYTEYIFLNREADGAWRANQEQCEQLRDSLQQSIARIKQTHQRLLESENRLKWAQEALQKVQADITHQLGRLINRAMDQPAFTALEQRLDGYLRLGAEVDQKEATALELQTEFDLTSRTAEEAESALRTRLGELELDTTDLPSALDTCHRQSERARQLSHKEAELEQLRLQQAALQRDLEQMHKIQANLTDVETQLSRLLLTEAGIDSTIAGLDQALAQFDTGLNNRQRWQVANQAYQAAVQHHHTLPDAHAQLELKASLMEQEAKLADIQAKHPDWVELIPEEIPQVYTRLINEIDEQKRETYQKYLNMQATTERVSQALRHPAELAEEVAEVRGNITRLEDFRAMLELAYVELARASQVFQQRFAPRLEMHMSEALSQISNGRYAGVTVDPKSLAVQLTSPELSNLVGVDRLSTGTRDMIYLTLRMGLARMMSRTGENLPLLLDDPLVQFDRGRQEEALRFLQHLAEDTQILMFTKDEWMKNWFEENNQNSSLHSVHVLNR